MRKPFFLLLFLFNISILKGQSFNEKKDVVKIEKLIKKGDSLRSTNKEKSLKIFKKGLAIALDQNLNNQAAILYKKIGVIYHLDKNYDVAQNMYRTGITLDSVSNVTADLFYNISLIKNNLNQLDSAFYYLNESIKLYEEFNQNKSAFNAFLRAGIVYKDRQLYEQALIYSIKAYDGFTKNNNKRKLADACTIIGNIQNQIKNHNQALEYHFQALELNKSLKNNLGMGICYTNIANAYDNLKEQDSAIMNYTKALKFFNNETSYYAVLLNNLAQTYKKNNDVNTSQTYFQKAIKINETLKDTTSLIYNYNGITSLFLANEDTRSAKKYLNKSNSLLSSVTDQRIILNFYENQAEYHQKIKNYKKALDYQTKYIHLYEKIYNSENAEIVQNLQAKFNYEKRENEILKLKLENNNTQLLLAEKNISIRNKNLSLIILAVIIILLGIVYYLFIQKQKTNAQAVKIERLEAIYQGQESIKKRIARDLHDIITTNFDGLRLRILALKRSNKVNEMVDEITGDLKKMNQQIRTVSHRLHPLEMYMGKQKFTDIIKSRLSEFQLYGNIFVELENQLPEILNTLSLASQNNFYGILLEILNNVEKHALATKILIKNFVDSKNNLHFIFEDNGIGIKNSHKEGIGIINIKQRVEILEGACKIGKTVTGTQVHIYFPIL